jgi:hypothetical protein
MMIRNTVPTVKSPDCFAAPIEIVEMNINRAPISQHLDIKNKKMARHMKIEHILLR